MAEIYNSSSGQQVYDNNGQTYDAKTGAVVGSAPAKSTSTTSPLIVTSGASKTQYNGNVQKLSSVTTPQNPPATSGTQTTGQTISSPTSTASNTGYDPASSTYSPTGKDVFGNPVTAGTPVGSATGAPSTGKIDAATGETATTASTGSPTNDPSKSALDPALAKAYNDSLTSLDQGIARAKANLDAAQATLAYDPQAEAAISLIKSKYEVQIQAMKDKNAILLGSYKSNSARTGMMQYASDMNTNFMSEEQDKASRRVTDLINEETNAIMQAQASYKAGDVKALNEAMTAYDKANTDKLGAVKDLIKLTNDAIKQQQDAVLAQRKQEAEEKKNAADQQHQEFQDLLAGSKFTYQQKQDMIDNAYKMGQLSETARHNKVSEAISQETALRGTYSLHDNADGTQSIMNTATGEVMGVPTNDVPLGIMQPGNTGNPLLDANTKNTSTGIPYVDGTNLTGKQATGAQLTAAKVGLPYLGKDGANAMNNINAIKSDLTMMEGSLDSLNPSVGGPWRWAVAGTHAVENATQMGPGQAELGSFNTYRESAIKAIQALAAGGSGLRITQPEITQMVSNIPSYNDTKDRAAAKLKVLRGLINNNEKSIVGEKAYDLYNPDQAAKDLADYAQVSADHAAQIDTLRTHYPDMTPSQMMQIILP